MGVNIQYKDSYVSLHVRKPNRAAYRTPKRQHSQSQDNIILLCHYNNRSLPWPELALVCKSPVSFIRLSIADSTAVYGLRGAHLRLPDGSQWLLRVPAGSNHRSSLGQRVHGLRSPRAYLAPVQSAQCQWHLRTALVGDGMFVGANRRVA